MAIPTALLAKILGGIGVVAAATVVGVTASKPKTKVTPPKPQENKRGGTPKVQSNRGSKPKGSTPEETLKALNEKIKALGITGCELENGQSKTSECSLDAEKIKAIKFDGKSGETLSPNNASLSLTIEKGYEDFRNINQSNVLYFPEGLRFIFTNSNGNDVTIGDTTNQITFKSNTTYDYKIKTSDNTTTLEKAWDLGSIVEIAGAECKTQGNGGSITECSLRAANINVWKSEGNNKFGLSPASSNPPPSTPTPTKIKVAKDSAGYRQGIKFYVEEEITLKISSGFTLKDYPLNKETSYEIDIREVEEFKSKGKQRVKKWFLVDKSTGDLNKKIQALGITGCDLVEGKSKTQECSLDAEKIKSIKFDGKSGDSLTPESTSLTLTIERDHLGTEFPLGLRFTFTNSSDNEVTIGSSSSITLKAGVSYDFKIKTENSNETKLEKAWKLTTLAAKVGLTCTDDTTSDCTLPTTGINVWKSEEDYITGATQKDSSKKMTVTKESSGYLEGFKFTLKEENEEINLQGGTKKKTDGISKLTKTNMSCGIDVKEVDGIKTWFLVEKSTTPT